VNTEPDWDRHLHDQRLLLQLARQAVGCAAHLSPLPEMERGELSEWLRSHVASFVTLTAAGSLRGCIGGLYAAMPLVDDVRQHAYAAATEDPRFPPVLPEEVPHLRIEISVLSSPQPLAQLGPDDLLRQLRPGLDGVILQSGRHRATFLPQVWAKIPDPGQFLTVLCEKAYLPGDAWRSGRLEVLTYQVESFEEPEPPDTSSA
jgi:uncharacterized protein